MTLVRIVKDWDWPDLLRQTPGGKGRWEDIDFVLSEAGECDFLVILNNRLKQPATSLCPPEHVWMIVQEPYYPGLTDWVIEHHAPFARVYTHHPQANTATTRYFTAPPAIPWYINKDYDELAQAQVPEKTKSLSWVVGSGSDLPGHLDRARFLHFIQQTDLEIDLWGRAVRPIDDKWDGLAPYRFSIAVENNSGPDMWTEKLADCFLSWSIPLYHGCTNLEKYFPKEAFIPIDINNPAEALATIRREATPESWQARLPALAKARQLVLEKYQLFPFLVEQIKRGLPVEDTAKRLVTIPSYHRSPLARCRRIFYKAKRRFF